MTGRVLLITQWFEPEPTLKGLVFAKELVEQGFEVEVITGFPNYPGGKLYPGYSIRPIQREVIDGIAVTRVPLYPSHDRSAKGRIANYLSFGASALAYGIAAARRADVIYAYHPPLTVGIAAALIRRVTGTPVVYDIQDMWPDTLRATGMLPNESVLAWIERACDAVYAQVDEIVVLSPGFKELLIGRGVPAHKLSVIYNWCNEAALQAADGPAPELGFGPDRFRILFAGNIGPAQSLEAVLEAAQLLATEAPRVAFVFLGGGLEKEAMRRRAQEMELSNVCFLDPVPMAEVGRYLVAAEACLVHLKQDPLFEITIPSKTQAYMSVGQPILMAVDGDAAELVRTSDCGRTARSEDPRSIADAAAELAALSPAQLRQMGTRGREYYEEHLSTASGARQFGGLFARLAARRGTQRTR